MKTDDGLKIYITYCKVYDKYTKRLMKLSKHKAIESTLIELEVEANKFIEQLQNVDSVNRYYVEKITSDIASTKSSFL
jgi:hypothetical protein